MERNRLTSDTGAGSGMGRCIKVRWNISAEVISMVMLGIIGVYARKGSHLPTLKNRMFQGCLLVTFSAILTNILSTIMIYRFDRIPLALTELVTMVYYMLTPLMGLAYFLYTVSVIYPEGAHNKPLRRVIGVGLIPGALYMLMVLANPFTHSLFIIDAERGYERGGAVAVTYLVFYAYCLASIIVTILNFRRIDRKIYRILAAFPVLAVLVILVQQFYPNVILSGSAATCALLIIYLHLQNKQITVDYLTGVPNRQELLDMLGYMIKRTPSRHFVLVVVSLRDFRLINNTCGQIAGDEFLKKICQFLVECGPYDNVYRFSGDEFALLFTNEDGEQIAQCVQRIETRMTQPWQAADYSFTISAVMGVISHSRGDSLEQTISAIEYAVYEAKTGKFGTVCYCDQKMLEKRERRREIIQVLRGQLAQQSFEMYYQPIYSVKTGTFRFAESLMRIPDSPIGPLMPFEFIPIAEETGLIADITYVVLDKVCKFINRLLEKGIDVGSIHVNFSGVQFSQADLAERVMEIIRRNNTPPETIVIEFTESTLAESTQVVTAFALEMMRYGIKMGLDDFGTGYSNIASVINIPFGTVKLDKSLVWASMESEKSALAIKNLCRTFNELGMKVVAEGVETEKQRQLVVDFGVDQIQGYYYAKPLPADEMEEFMLKQKGVGHGG